MDNKLKLNAKMNIAIAWCGFWIRVSKLCGNLHEFVLDKAKKAHAKEIDILREMLNEDYPEEVKNDFRSVLKMEEGS